MDFHRPTQHGPRPSNYILANMPEAEYNFLSRSLMRLELPLGYRFAGPGDRMEYVYFPVSGVVSTDALTEAGESIEIGVTGKEGLIGTSALLGQPEMMHSIIMQVAGNGLRVRVGVAQELLRQHGRFTELVFEHVSLQMLQMGQSALCNRLHPVKERLARWLLTASDRNQSERLGLTQEFLSQMLGSRRSTVTVMAGELQRDGLIEYSRGKIKILDREGLQGQSCECYRIVSGAYRKALGGETSKAN